MTAAVATAAEAPPAGGTAFVVSPFGEPYDTYYRKIYLPAIANAHLDGQRGDDIFRSGNVVRHIVELILRSSVVVAELSQPNANVYYELGLAHMAEKPCVLLTETGSEIPFDLQNQRHISYSPRDPDWAEKLRGDITRAITETLAEPTASKPFPLDWTSGRTARGDDGSSPPEVLPALQMVQATLDSLRQDLRVSLRTGSAADLPPAPSATELRAYAARELGRGVTQAEVIEALRAHGAPTPWAREVVGEILRSM
ncbi:hypothetical protein ACNTMW_13285 [Planosporangium sp. 12N6]|uniref:hypothetical protein n=1 Tax=Planosporangium spinosum TaxID=3402278 RepID=UPI003CF63283